MHLSELVLVRALEIAKIQINEMVISSNYVDLFIGNTIRPPSVTYNSIVSCVFNC